MAKKFNRALRHGYDTYILANGNPIFLTDIDIHGKITRSEGTTIPGAESGFAKGSIFVKTDAAPGTKALYENQGTSDSASFNLIGDVTAAEINLATGNILIGDNAGQSTELDIGNTDGGLAIGNGVTATIAALSGDITMTNLGVTAIGTDKVTKAMLNADVVGAGLIQETGGMIAHGVTIFNNTGGALTPGTLVYLSSFVGTSGITVVKADADANIPATHVVMNQIEINTSGNVYEFALVSSLNTNGRTIGDAVYLDAATAGGFTYAAPTGADQVVQQVGTVKVVSATVGEIDFWPSIADVKKVGSSYFQPASVLSGAVGFTIGTHGADNTGSNTASISVGGNTASDGAVASASGTASISVGGNADSGVASISVGGNADSGVASISMGGDTASDGAVASASGTASISVGGNADSGVASISVGGNADSGVASISMGGDTAETTLKIVAVGSIFQPIAAETVSVHASFEDNAASPITTGLTNPDFPRNVQIAFGASWAGGDITVAGTDQFDAAANEVIADNPGSTVVGTKIFKTVTSLAIQTPGGGGAGHTAEVGVGNKLGVTEVMADAVGVVTIGGTSENVVFDGALHAFTPTNVPNASRVYFWMVPVEKTHKHGSTGLTATDAGHTHNVTSVTATDAGHTHNVTSVTATDAGHTHTGGAHTHGATGLTATDAGHTHNLTSATATDAGHTHTGGAHTHGATGLTATDAGHTHNVTSVTATDAGHTHNVTSVTATDAGHTHTGGAHTHGATGLTATDAGHTHSTPSLAHSIS